MNYTKDKQLLELLKDKEIKIYYDYKMKYIKNSFNEMIKDLIIDIINLNKSYKKAKRIYNSIELKKYKKYLYQTPKTINDIIPLKIKIKNNKLMGAF